MKPIASFGAMFLWAVLLIAGVGVAASLTQVEWVPVLAWAIVAGGAAAALIRLRRQVGGTRALDAREQQACRPHRRSNETHLTRPAERRPPNGASPPHSLVVVGQRSTSFPTPNMLRVRGTGGTAQMYVMSRRGPLYSVLCVHLPSLSSRFVGNRYT